jgi:uncharacterized integral membrane protein
MGERHGRRQRGREFRGTGIYWNLLVAVALVAAILVAIVQNTQDVELKYLGWDVHTPLIVVMLVTIFVTAVFTGLVGFAWRWRRRSQLAKRAELEELRGQSRRPAGSALPAGAPPPAAPPPPQEPSSGVHRNR